MPSATTIDEVITLLSEIITTEASAKSNLAFFPVLYKKVTERIKLGIQNEEFDDNPEWRNSTLSLPIDISKRIINIKQAKNLPKVGRMHLSRD